MFSLLLFLFHFAIHLFLCPLACVCLFCSALARSFSFDMQRFQAHCVRVGRMCCVVCHTIFFLAFAFWLNNQKNTVIPMVFVAFAIRLQSKHNSATWSEYTLRRWLNSYSKKSISCRTSVGCFIFSFEAQGSRSATPCRIHRLK